MSLYIARRVTLLVCLSIYSPSLIMGSSAGATMQREMVDPAEPSCEQVASPNPFGDSNQLYAVSGSSSQDVWAVGQGYTLGTTNQTLIEHWDGARWSVVPSPNQGDHSNFLYGVAAVSSTDAWAVGYTSDGANSKALIEHWDGAEWTIVPAPDPGTGQALSAVTAISATDVWAVGTAASANGTSHLLAIHWDGGSWSVRSPARTERAILNLEGVSGTASNDVWAVGQTYGGLKIGTLTEHWDGTAWDRVRGPSSNESFLRAVDAVATDDVWAVGYERRQGSYPLTLIQHWDGAAWSTVTSPNQPQGSNFLYGVTASSRDEAWAVGNYQDQSFLPHTLALHWDGTAWAIAPSSDPGSLSLLDGAASTPEGDVWAVGWYLDPDSGVYATLTERCSA
jgi:hypothetical protein